VGGIATNFVGLEALALVRTFFGSSIRGAAATGLAAGLRRDRLVRTGLSQGLGTVFGAVLLTEVCCRSLGRSLGSDLEALAFEPVAFAQFLQSCLALRFFCFSRVCSRGLGWRPGIGARPWFAPRLAAAAFLETLETLFLRVFCDTACARNCHAPVRWFSGNP